MFRAIAILFVFALTALVSGTVDLPGATGPPDLEGLGERAPLPERVEFRLLAEGFEAPIDLQAPSGDPRIFVVEKAGTIRILHPDGSVDPEPFLDISSAVYSDGNEQGLVGMVFHPEYADNGRFFIFYTDLTEDVVIAEMRVDAADPSRADPDSARAIMEVDQPNQYHNGGAMAFGPDGFLYIGLGDGGGIGDTYKNGQNPTTLPGTIARIDVDGDEPYAIPGDNPFVHSAGAVEAVYYGVRNPWRFSIDAETGLIYVADVGQNRWEEITVLSPDEFGANLGWPVLEGFECFDSDAARADEHEPQPCDRAGLRLPDHVVAHGGNCAIVGGPVYRGSAIPDLVGHYLYADFCGGWVRGFTMVDGIAVDHREWTRKGLGAITTMGVDGSDEVLVATTAGNVFRIVPPEV